MHCTCTNVIALGLSIVLFWTSEPIGAAEVIVPDEMKNSTIQVSTGLPPQPYKDEWRRSCPDFLVFHPAPDGNPRWEDDDFCVLSEHFIVVPTEGNRLLATWTSHGPRLAFSRIMVARSENGGQNGIPLDVAGNEPRYEAAAYGSLTPAEDGYVLWYPDRKHFLLGKRIPEALLREMEGQEDTHTTNSARPGEVR